MPLLTPDEAQARIGTPLDDVSLAALIADIEAEIAAEIGPPNTAITEAHAGYCGSLFLKRKIASVTTVTEYETLTDTAGTVLTANEDYFVWADEGRIQRLDQKWQARATVVYVPVDDTPKRKQVVIDLLKFYLAYSPLKSENISGEYSFAAPENWETEKSRLLRRLKFTEL